MQENRVRSALLLLVVVGAAACDDATTPGTGGGTSSSSSGTTTDASTSASNTGSTSTGAPAGDLAADYCAPLAALICERAASCSCGAVLPSGAFDEGACAEAFAAECVEAYGPVQQAIQMGLARVDAARAAACVALIASSTPGCERPRGAVSLGLCPAWFTSDTPLGATCEFPICADGDGYCGDGGTCVPRPTSGACSGYECAPGTLCLDGACQAPGAMGATCATDDACAAPLRCVDGACAGLGAAGATCSGQTSCAVGLSCPSGQCVDAPPTPCSDVAVCGNQEVCAHVRTCEALGADGSPCETNGSCGAGLGCDSMTMKCVPLPASGSPCLNGASCASGSACSLATSVCGPLPGTGEPCAMDARGPFVCASGLGCLASNLCGPLPIAGEACVGLNACAPGLGCDFTPSGSVCVTKKPAGGACQNDLVCAPGLHCDFGVGSCAADQPLGTPCKDGNECGPAAVCLPGSGGAFECAPTPGPGDGCQFDCVPGLQCVANPANAFCASPICLEI